MGRFDTSIYSNPLRSVADYESELDKRDISRQNLMLNKLKMDEYQRGVQEQNALRGVYGSLGADPQANYQTLLNRAGPEAANKYMKGIADTEEQRAQAAEREWKIKKEKIGVVGSAAKFVMENPTPENLTMGLKALVDNGVMSAEQANQYLQQGTQNPALIRPQAEMLFRSAVEADKQLASFVTRNTGGTTDTLRQDPVTGQVATANVVKNTQTPDSIASNARIAAEGAANRALQRELEAGRQSRAADGTQLPKPPKDMRYKADGSGELEPIPGSETDRKRNEVATKAKNFSNQANDKLNNIEKNVDRMLSSPALGKDVTADVDGKPVKKSSNAVDVATGLRGVIARRIPGSEATDFEARKETVLANLGFKELNEMRASSPTGGALGQVTERELAFLQATVASLQAAQSPDAMEQALKDVKQALITSRRRIAEAARADGAVISSTGDGWSIRPK